jgi:hypothetical protein
MSIVARAIYAAMLRAEPAGLFQSLAQLLPGAMMPHAQIVGRHPQCYPNLLGSFTTQIQPADEFRVIRLERGNQSFDTTTGDAFLRAVRRGIQFMFQPLQRRLVHRAAPIEINDRVAEDAVKPRHSGFLPGRLFGRSERFHQTFLHHIFGEMRIPDAAARERYEGLQVFKQRFFNVLHGKEFRPAALTRKAMTRQRTKINCNEGKARAFASVNEDC